MVQPKQARLLQKDFDDVKESIPVTALINKRQMTFKSVTHHKSKALTGQYDL